MKRFIKSHPLITSGVVLIALLILACICPILFYICCEIMVRMDDVWKVSYYEANSICFLVGQPVIYLICAMFTCFVAMIVCPNKPKTGALSVMYLSVYVLYIAVLWLHYYNPDGLEGACKLAMSDMGYRDGHVTALYILLNLLWFIVFFLMVVGGNLVAIWYLIKKFGHSQKESPQVAAPAAQNTQS